MIPTPLGQLHPHLLFDALSYTGGFALYRILRKRTADAGLASNPGVTSLAGLWLLAGAVLGAAVGAKLLAWAEHPHVYFDAMAAGQLHAWLGGKTIVGGLLGGWAGVELAKWHVGLKRSTGDLFVFPLILGTAFGRVGCFLTGLADMTYGTPTSLPWAVDFGDGVPRHPTQLYEIAFVLLLGVALFIYQTGPAARRAAARRNEIGQAAARRAAGPAATTDGTLFRLYLGGYLAWRLAVEFLKPSPKNYAGLSAIQWASLLGVVVCVSGLIRRNRRSA